MLQFSLNHSHGNSTQMRVCSLLGGACNGSISGGTLVVGGLVAMRLLLIM
jgi:hypothetical protein